MIDATPTPPELDRERLRDRRLGHDAQLLRIEEAGLNASATSRQLLYDGWLLRFSPDKAQRARCINALAPSRLPLGDKLDFVRAHYRALGLPLLFRITPFSRPGTLDQELAARGFVEREDTRVMSGPLDQPPAWSLHRPLPPDHLLEQADAVHFAEAVGQLRGSPPEQRAAHAKRLADSPLPALRAVVTYDNAPVCVGQCVLEERLVGLYDIVTAPQARGRGLARFLSAWLLAQAHARGARQVYLQVDADNHAARRVYQSLGLQDCYAYWYRAEPQQS
jgi:GNAT superfamily N-acetyltransferase